MSELTELHAFLRQRLSPRQDLPTKETEFARVEAYWHLGRIIVEKEQDGKERADYGVELIELLSAQLTEAYGKGYGRATVWRFKQFYLAFPILATPWRELNFQQTPPLRKELSWSHYRELLCIEGQKRDFYLHSAADERWSVRTLKRLIHSRYYEQVALGEEALLTAQANSPSPPTLLSRRARLALVRQAVLNTPGWASIERKHCGLPLIVPKPDLLFYQFHQQRLVGLWLAEYHVATAEAIRRQLLAWQGALPEHSKPPLGLLVSTTGKVTLLGEATATERTAFQISLPESLNRV